MALLPAVAGHAALLRRRAQGAPSVVLAWDIRAYTDLRGELGRAGAAGQAHPLMGWRSEDFARAAAEVYAAAGVRVWLPGPPADGGRSALSTPELSFAIRALKAEGLSILLSEQNPGFAAAIADRAYLLETGQIRHEGPMAAVMADAALRARYLSV